MVGGVLTFFGLGGGFHQPDDYAAGEDDEHAGQDYVDDGWNVKVH
jgi:hypothetical protein